MQIYPAMQFYFDDIKIDGEKGDVRYFLLRPERDCRIGDMGRCEKNTNCTGDSKMCHKTFLPLSCSL